MLSICVAFSLLGTPSQPTQPILLREGYSLRSVSRGGRSAVQQDALVFAWTRGIAPAPKSDDEVTLPGGQPSKWQPVQANDQGVFTGPETRGGYVALYPTGVAPGIYVLEASGHALAYVNGEPRGGDPYGYGYLGVPVKISADSEPMLFTASRGQLRVALRTPRADIELDARDATLPDGHEQDSEYLPFGIHIRNNTESWQKGIVVKTKIGNGETISTPLTPLPPLSVTKPPIALKFPEMSSGEVEMDVAIYRDNKLVERIPIKLRIRKETEAYKQTFISEIDGSAQYYGVQPGRNRDPRGPLYLSLHGASVEAIGQAEAYSPKPFGPIVCPTNRRPFGFDWEDWGRLDALEVLNDAKFRFEPDPSRIYLTGHSMGGHGSWQLASHFPNLFAAVGPSAGWVSFWSYAGGIRFPNPGPIEKMLERAASPSDTLGLIENLTRMAIYILHGDADDNVPVTEARAMREALKDKHNDLHWFEQKGAGHWWDASPEPGADCVDWEPMFTLFSKRRLPSLEDVREETFCTWSPTVNDEGRRVRIEQQIAPFQLSKVSLKFDPLSRKCTATTQNVQRLMLNLQWPKELSPIALNLDGQTIQSPREIVFLRRVGERWEISDSAPVKEKNPVRGGSLRELFRNRPILLFATGGTPEENRWAYAKARYDQETFLMRGNGYLELRSDKEFDAKRDKDRNVVLYGNADINRAWKQLLGGSEIEVRRGEWVFGDKRFVGSDLAGLFLVPSPLSDRASVGAVAITGDAGQRAAERIPIFLSGAGFPDVFLIRSEMWNSGSVGVILAGYFGNDWKIQSGDFAIREMPKH